MPSIIDQCIPYVFCKSKGKGKFFATDLYSVMKNKCICDFSTHHYGKATHFCYCLPSFFIHSAQPLFSCSLNIVRIALPDAHKLYSSPDHHRLLQRHSWCPRLPLRMPMWCVGHPWWRHPHHGCVLPSTKLTIDQIRFRPCSLGLPSLKRPTNTYTFQWFILHTAPTSGDGFPQFWFALLIKRTTVRCFSVV